MFGKRDKSGPRQPQHDPISSFAAAPLPRHAGPPASSTPLADHLARGGPGVDQGYVVLPRSLAEQMPLPWQQQLTGLLAQFHQTHRDLSWPLYRVVPSREEKLVDLDEEQLAEVGYLVEIDAQGEMVYRERNGRKVERPEETTVLVSCLDPIATGRPGAPSAQATGQSPATGQGGVPPAPPPRAPAPMNIGPQPVWSTVPDKARTPQQSRDWFTEPADDEPASPDEPAEFGPTGEPIERPYRFGP